MRRTPEDGLVRRIPVFTGVLIVGFAAFAAPAILLQVGFAGGYRGSNLAVLGVVQLVLVGAVIAAGLRMLGLRFSDIGFASRRWRRDALLGAVVAAAWAALQFGWLFPATGGASREDIAGILTMVDGRWINVLWYLPLGILGGGVAEEMYFRGFLITVLRDILATVPGAAAIAGTCSILFFALGHLPADWVDWMDIVVPGAAYVALFLGTGRLTAPMVAHGLWNATAVVGIHLLYG